MKKLATIAIVLVYSLSVSGLSLQFHYCCGKLKKISCTTAAEKKCCGQSGHQCHCTKATDSTDNTPAGNIIPTLKFVSQPTSGETPKTALCYLSQHFAWKEFPPPVLPDHLFLLNCVFRI